MICWYCKKVEMQRVKDDRGFGYDKCPKCGATDTGKLPLLPIPQNSKRRLKGTVGYRGIN